MKNKSFKGVGFATRKERPCPRFLMLDPFLWPSLISSSIAFYFLSIEMRWVIEFFFCSNDDLSIQVIADNLNIFEVLGRKRREGDLVCKVHCQFMNQGLFYNLVSNTTGALVTMYRSNTLIIQCCHSHCLSLKKVFILKVQTEKNNRYI